MMGASLRYRVRQRMFGLGGSYTVTTLDGEPAYQVKSSPMGAGASLELLDIAGTSVASIQQRVLSFNPTYEIVRNGYVVATVRRDAASPFRPRFVVDSTAGRIEIDGDLAGWNYTIAAEGRQVAVVDREHALQADGYAVAIVEGADVPTFLSLVIVIDEVSHSER